MNESFQYTRRPPLPVPSHCFGGKADVIDAENLNAWRQSVAMLSEVFGFLNVEFINVCKSGDRVAIPLWRKPLLQLV
ncbi:MAG TPA: hypothetical protein PKY85_08660 [Nitrosomonas sp.]|nr:hypothetical protein [Nitrosomonas sp.]